MHRQTIKTGRLRLYLLLLLAVVAVMFLLKQCSTPTPDDNRADDYDPLALRVAIEYSPLAVESRGDTLGGFGYELLRALSRDTAVGTVRFIPVVSARKAMEGLDSGLYDLVVAEIPMTATLRSKYRFTAPVYLDRQVLVQRLDSSGKPMVDDQLGLAGQSVAVVAESPAHTRLKSLAREIGDSINILADTIHGAEQLVMLVNAGEVPLAVVNGSTALAMAPDYPRLKMGPDISLTQFQAWIVGSGPSPRGKDTGAVIDSALSRFKRTAAYRNLLTRYHLHPAP